MRKVVLYVCLAGVFGLAMLLEHLLTSVPPEPPDNHLVVVMGGDGGPEQIPSSPPRRPRQNAPPGTDRQPDPAANSLRLAGQDPAPTDAKNGRSEYVVKAGDSLWTLARDFLGASNRWRELAEFNGIEPQDVREGLRLKFPGTAHSGSNKDSTNKGPANRSSQFLRTHEVVAGESLSSIAQKFLGDSTRWREIQQLNNIENPDRLRAGTVLELPRR